MFGNKRRTIKRMSADIIKLIDENEAKDYAISGLQKALAYAADPFNMISAQEAVERATAADAPVVQMPDGEYVAPGSYQWEKLAQDIIDFEERQQGGASESW